MDRKKYLDGTEVGQLLKTCRAKLREKDFLQKRDAILVLTMLNSGGRVSECRQLQVGDITFGKSPSIRFRRETTKGKRKGRTVPISKKFAGELKRFLKAKTDEKPFLFPGNNGSALSGVRCWQIWKFMLWESGVPEHYGCHATRHSYGFQLYKKSGHNLKMVQEMLGHSSLTSTQVYMHTDHEATVAAVNSLWLPIQKS
jgi:integrase